MKVGIIVQARMTSTRFPNKIFAKLGDKPVLKHVLDNISKLRIPVVVAIPNNPTNDVLYEWLKANKYEVFRGREHDVLDRFYQCNKKYRFDVIIRINGETPFIRATDVNHHLERFLALNRFVYGDGCWIFNKEMLVEAWNNEFDAETRQHVVRYFFNAVDYPQDIARLEKMLSNRSRALQT